jgi:hypothetical protein
MARQAQGHREAEATTAAPREEIPKTVNNAARRLFSNE